MKKLIIAIACTFLAAANLYSQDPIRRTYPIDSCLYFMDPFNFRIQNVFTFPGGGDGAVTLFRSTGSPDLFISGRGRFPFDVNSLPPGVTLDPETTGQLLLSVPEPPEGSDNWPGGVPPFPLILPGFIEKVGDTAIDPPIPITIQVAQLFFENTTE